MRIKHLILLFFLCIVFSACEKDEPITKTSRSVLIYMAGDNSLSSYSDQNFQLVLKGVSGNLNNGNLLVYMDQRGKPPRLYHITQKGKEEPLVREHVYEEQNSASAETLTNVLNTMIRDYPADSYGLVLWSHGTAWLPSDLHNYTRAFGQDGSSWMEINELSAALSNYHFDFLVFDACLMGSVEVAYAFKNCTDYLVASPTEVMATGFPYDKIVQPMFAMRPDVVKIAEEFYNYYNNQPENDRHGTISAIKMSGLDQLAAACRPIFKDKTEEELFAVRAGDLQLMEYLSSNYHALYDFDDYVSRLATPSQYETFRSALDEAVLYKAATPKSYFNYPRIAIAIRKFSGLSVYVPQAALSNLNEWYKRLDWYKAVYE